MMLGKHLVKHWAKTQTVLSLSSAEAELYAAVKASSEALGSLPLLEDFDVHTTGKRMTGTCRSAKAQAQLQGKAVQEREGL